MFAYFPSLMSIEELISSVDSVKTGKKNPVRKEMKVQDENPVPQKVISAEKEKTEESGRSQSREEKTAPDRNNDADAGESIEKMKKDKQIKNLTSKIQGRIISIENLEGDK